MFGKFSLFFAFSTVVSMMTLTSNATYAGTAGGIYDMSALLNQPHPFARTANSPRPNLGGQVIRPPANPQSDAPPAAAQIPMKPAPVARAKAGQPNGATGNIVSEIRVGAFLHDFGPFSHRKEDGYDANVEVLFSSPDFLKAVWSPRPHVGASYSTNGDTNQAYVGLTWEWMFWGNYFANFSLGGAYHDGYKETYRTDKKSLGCNILFRESIDVGYRFGGVHSIMAHLDHISNAKLCSTNEGLESVGIRYGYHF